MAPNRISNFGLNKIKMRIQVRIQIRIRTGIRIRIQSDWKEIRIRSKFGFGEISDCWDLNSQFEKFAFVIVELLKSCPDKSTPCIRVRKRMRG